MEKDPRNGGQYDEDKPKDLPTEPDPLTDKLGSDPEPREPEEVQPLSEVAEEVAPEDAVINPWARLVAVVFSPGDAMRGVAQKGGWLIPFLVVVVATILFMLIAGDVVQEFAAEKMREQFAEQVASGQISQEQADQIMAQWGGGGAMRIFMIINPVIASLVMKLVLAALAILVGNIFLGGNAKFGKYWSAMWYAGVIGAIALVVSSILINITGDMQGAQLGLGILTKAEPTSTAHKIAQSFNIFTIWEAVVAGIGVAVLAKVNQTKGIIGMLVVYLGISILTSLLAGQPMV